MMATILCSCRGQSARYLHAIQQLVPNRDVEIPQVTHRHGDQSGTQEPPRTHSPDRRNNRHGILGHKRAGLLHFPRFFVFMRPVHLHVQAPHITELGVSSSYRVRHLLTAQHTHMCNNVVRRPAGFHPRALLHLLPPNQRVY